MRQKSSRGWKVTLSGSIPGLSHPSRDTSAKKLPHHMWFAASRLPATYGSTYFDTNPVETDVELQICNEGVVETSDSACWPRKKKQGLNLGGF